MITRLFFHWKKYHRREKMRPISHEKNNHMGKSCVTMIDFMVKFYETDLSDVIFEEFSKSSALTGKENYKKYCTKTSNATENIYSKI